MHQENIQNFLKILFLALVGIAFAFFLPQLLEVVQFLGHRIPQYDRAEDFLKGFAVAAAITLVLYGLPLKNEEKRYLLAFWIIKAFITLVVMLFYEWNYGLDAYEYFRRSQLPTIDLHFAGVSRGTDNLIAFFWYLENHIFRTGSYHTQKLLCSFVGFMAVWLFYRGLKKIQPDLKPSFLLFLGLYPSILFWSSILGKDPIMLFGICLFFYGAFSFWHKPHPAYFAAALVGIVVVAAIRSWIVPVLILPLGIALALRVKSNFFRLIFFCVLGFAILKGIQTIGKELAIESAESLAQTTNAVSRSWNFGGSSTEIPELSSPGAMLRFLPIGIFTALFRPLPGEILNPFGLVAGVENLFLLYLLGLAIWRFRRSKLKDPLAIWMLSYVILWSCLYAFVSPQNLGAAVRFRLQALPQLLLLLLLLSEVSFFRAKPHYPGGSKDSTHRDDPDHGD